MKPFIIYFLAILTFLYGCDSEPTKLYPFNNQYDKYGYKNGDGEVIIEAQFDYADFFSEGLARVYKDEKWGFIDKSGNTVIPLVYDYVNPFSEGLAEVEKDEKSYYIDKSGNTVE